MHCLHKSPQKRLTLPTKGTWILTLTWVKRPLLDCPIETVRQDPMAAIHRLQQQYGGTVILKGAGTLVLTQSGELWSDAGNPGMASGGMGDVLSGLIGALLAQGYCGCSGPSRCHPCRRCRSLGSAQGCLRFVGNGSDTRGAEHTGAGVNAHA